MKSKKIETIEQLEQCAINRKSVYCSGREFDPMPAAVVLSMQCRVVLNRIRTGLYEYTPKKKKLYHENFQKKG